jgi:hypothetical protein
MLILISSRLFFSFSDVKDTTRNIIAAALILLLMGVLIRTMLRLILRRVKRKQNIVVSPTKFESLQPHHKNLIMESLIEYQLFFRNRILEIDYDYAMNSKAAQSYLIMNGKTASSAVVNAGGATTIELRSETPNPSQSHQ